MGNSQSSDDPKSPSDNASTTSSSSHRRERQARGSSRARVAANGSQNAPRKPQSHAPPHAPPAVALVSSSSSASTSTSNTHAKANLASSPAPSSHTRARSITTGTARVRGEDSTSRSPMGNAESRHRPPSRSSTLPPPPTDKPASSPAARPVDVPQPPNQYGFDELTPPMNSPLYALPSNDFSRPPRLPLPIERDPEPTSPIISAQDVNTPMEQLEEDDLVPRRASMLSSTTLDDDEVADIETFALESDPAAQKVLTTIQYKGDARSVFVTGTFARWEKKFRMQKGTDEDGKPLFTLTASLPVGTHHIRFLVDGEMIVTNQFLQTVDFTNSLVNYIEISAKTPPAEQTQAAVTLPSEPVPIPGSETVVIDHGVERPADVRANEQAPETQDQQPSEPIPVPEKQQDQHSQPIPIRNSQHPHAQAQPPQQQPGDSTSQPAGTKPAKKFLPRPKYTNKIPELLLHLDLYNDPENQDYLRASKAIEHLPQPPSLPLFMTKSILNATTPHKDDASVLTMPNHTVLNHLATSSIKSGVLATSGTTRYKKKFLTTIMYKPTSEDG